MNKYENVWIIWDEQIWKWMNILRRMNMKVNEYSRMNKFKNKWIFWDEKNMKLNEYYRLNKFEMNKHITIKRNEYGWIS